MAMVAPPPPPPDGAAAGVGKSYASYNGASSGGGAVASAAARWRREDLLERSPLALRAAAALFAFLAFVLMASNKHGGWMEFGRYEEYRFLVAVAAVAFVYSLAQAVRHAERMRGGADSRPASPTGRVLDFAGDQVLAYLLISALSAALPITDRMRSAVVNIFTDATASSISMAFFAFIALALSALVSGYKLSKQTYM